MKLWKQVKEKPNPPTIEEIRRAWADRQDEDYKIVNALGAILMRSNEFYAYPESSLPASKERVKEAIKRVLLLAREEEVNHLKVAYMYMADFIPDAEAERINAFGRKWLNPSAVSHTTPEEARQYQKEDKESNFTEHFQWSAEECEHLHKEIDEYSKPRGRPSKMLTNTRGKNGG